jgi:hypothetical protein
MIEEIDRALTQAAEQAAGRQEREAPAAEPGKLQLDERIAQTTALLKGFDDCLKLVQDRVGQCDEVLAAKEKAASEWLDNVRSIRQGLAAWRDL